MNAEGETFEEQPPPGVYLTCPLSACKYKLLIQGSSIDAGVHLVTHWVPNASARTLDEVINQAYLAQIAGQERLVQAHLKTHEMTDFHKTCGLIMMDAEARVARIMKLAALVFSASATKEPGA